MIIWQVQIVEFFFVFFDVEFQKLYLLSSIRSLISKREQSPSLLSSHIRLLMEFTSIHPGGPAKVLRTARKYTIKAPKSAHVWLSRLVAEQHFATESEGRIGVDRAWAEARRTVEGTMEDLERVWTWGLCLEDSAEDKVMVYEVCGNRYW
jgi:U3 small nucleolar RNA-associated protein 6